MKEPCLFCEIVTKKEKAHIIWEDEKHIAFLSIFPNTKGFTVVIPKIHYASYAFELSDTIYSELMIASKKVGLLLDRAFDEVARTGLIMEGYGVDHVHTKLIPMHGTAKFKKWEQVQVTKEKYFSEYEGYLSSHDCKIAAEKDLEMLAKKIRKIDL